MERRIAVVIAALLVVVAAGALLHGHPRGQEPPPFKPYDPLH